jgi:hypothetical protein
MADVKSNRMQIDRPLQTAKQRDDLLHAALNLYKGPLQERVAVPNPKGGFYMEVRDIEPVP